MEDRQIVALYHQRQERAIRESEKKYGAYCRRIARNILTLPEDAEECVSDTWLAAWNAMPPQFPQVLSAFFGRIVRNLSISRYRANHAQKRYSGLETLLSELEDCLPSPDTMERHLEQLELSGLIADWLEELSPDDRALFLGRYWYGEPVKTLAHRAGLSPNTASQRLGRLRQRLKQVLEAEGVAL